MGWDRGGEERLWECEGVVKPVKGGKGEVVKRGREARRSGGREEKMRKGRG